MRIAVVFHHDPTTRRPGVDVVRLEAMTVQLGEAGFRAEIVAPVAVGTTWRSGLTVRPLTALAQAGRYDLVKTCYHQSIKLIGDYTGPVVSRLVRIVDNERPRHDANQRAELLACQEMTARRAWAVATNNRENADRWRDLYGSLARPEQEVVLTPTGTAAKLPPPGPSPYGDDHRPRILFLGSVSAPRQARLVNHLAAALGDRAAIHHVGPNKTGLYGDFIPLDEAIASHGQIREERIWDWLRHADLGLILTYGPDRFENDIAKTYNYLRAGLPIVYEEPIIQDELIDSLAMGRGFEHGRTGALATAVEEMLAAPPTGPDRRAAAEAMVKRHTWAARAAVYAELFPRLTARHHRTGRTID